MTTEWIENGPVSLPPRPVAYGAGAVVAALAVVGVALGFHAGWRDGGTPNAAGGIRRGAEAGVSEARPLVEIGPPVAAPPKTEDTDAEKAAAEKAKELAAQQAAAQAIQAKAAKPAGNIDDILTSPAEKPPPEIKPAADEPPPKSDVPF